MPFVLADLIPLNLNQEKEKFFADTTYNPQFTYAKKLDQKQLEKYSKTHFAYADIAQEIVDKAYFGKTELDLLKKEGQKVNQLHAHKTIFTFLKLYNLHKRFTINWSASYVVRTSINENTMKLRLPADFRKEGLMGMLYHEVATHALRRINYEQQPWFEKKKQYGFAEYLPTEEGLATLHTLLAHNYKSAFNSALRYLTVAYAQEHSFTQTWDMLGSYIQDPERRWMVTFRQKRGLTDTSLPGGFGKDLVYFEGLVEVYRWLKKNNFDSTPLYFGKVALEDAHKAVALNPNFKPVLPLFLSLSKEKYAQEIKKIGDFNTL